MISLLKLLAVLDNTCIINVDRLTIHPMLLSSLTLIAYIQLNFAVLLYKYILDIKKRQLVLWKGESIVCRDAMALRYKVTIFCSLCPWNTERITGSQFLSLFGRSTWVTLLEQC